MHVTLGEFALAGEFIHDFERVDFLLNGLSRDLTPAAPIRFPNDVDSTDSVEGEALDRLFERRVSGGNASVQVSFEYHGYEVHVADGDGTAVEVRLS